MWTGNLLRCIVRQSKAVNFNATARRLTQSHILLNKEDQEEDTDLLFGMGNDDFKAETKLKNVSKMDFYKLPQKLAKNNMRDFGEKSTKKDGKTTKNRQNKKSVDRDVKTQNEIAAPATNENKRITMQKKATSVHIEKYIQHDEELDLWFYKLPFEHKMLNNLIMLSKSKKYREKRHLLVIEGRRLMDDILDAGLELKYLFFSKREQLEQIHKKLVDCKSTPKIIRVPHKELSFWSILSTCPGMIGVFDKPFDMEPIWDRAKKSSTSHENDGQPDASNTQPKVTVVCDQIREPNNLGSLIRTCAALPCSDIVLMKGCADPWETKALRGGAGGHFRVPVRGPMTWESLQELLPQDNQYTVFIADNKSNQQNHGMPGGPYHEIQYQQCKHIVLVIGGETEGVSKDAYKFMHSRQRLQQESTEESKEEQSSEIIPPSQCLQIPLASGVESLNVNAALAILLFGIRNKLQG